MANMFFLLMIFSRDFEMTLDKKWLGFGPKLQHIMKPILEEKSVMHREGAFLLCLQQINLPESQESKEFLLGLQQLEAKVRKETQMLVMQVPIRAMAVSMRVVTVTVTVAVTVTVTVTVAVMRMRAKNAEMIKSKKLKKQQIK